ncbi:hypothetical protein A0H76_2029 [Hepatospora eriocheir]|uniref:Uncharacterized protein n=1 Tax=Hepatospora eriocheir TaxID=1081669 RepID=A0A1X0QFX8_9MICR|nr:hypothetical protein A0H76_2029 [Hepatospora eriocheir]
MLDEELELLKRESKRRGEIKVNNKIRNEYTILREKLKSKYNFNREIVKCLLGFVYERNNLKDINEIFKLIENDIEIEKYFK